MSLAHGRHVWLGLEQTGVVLAHWAFETHETQVPVAV